MQAYSHPGRPIVTQVGLQSPRQAYSHPVRPIVTQVDIQSPRQAYSYPGRPIVNKLGWPSHHSRPSQLGLPNHSRKAHPSGSSRHLGRLCQPRRNQTSMQALSPRQEPVSRPPWRPYHPGRNQTSRKALSPTQGPDILSPRQEPDLQVGLIIKVGTRPPGRPYQEGLVSPVGTGKSCHLFRSPTYSRYEQARTTKQFYSPRQLSWKPACCIFFSGHFFNKSAYLYQPILSGTVLSYMQYQSTLNTNIIPAALSNKTVGNGYRDLPPPTIQWMTYLFCILSPKNIYQ